MTKTIDEQLERLASAQERTATALEAILEAVTNFQFTQAGEIAMAGVNIEEAPDAGADHEAAPKEATSEEPETVEEEPEPKEEGAAERATEDEAAGEDGDEGDPLGDGEAADDPYQLPEKLTNDTLRSFARDLVEKEGKAAVFEVLADIGKGYKAVGEVSKADLLEAHEKMIARLRG